MDIESRMLLLLLILLLNITVSVSAIQDVKVSCRNEKICALKESSVNLKCSYSNINITTGFWFSLKDKAKWRKEEQPEDLALDSDYAGRVSYTEMTNFSSTLTITDLRERDSGEYRLMFITDKGEKYLSSAGVTLTVAGDEQSSTVMSNLHAVWGVGALLIVVPCIKRKRGAETDTDIQSVRSPGDDTYTSLNPMTMSPDYDTLQNVQGSASDTYATLNPATMSSDYDTLRDVAT